MSIPYINIIMTHTVFFRQSVSLFIIAAVAAAGVPKPSVIGMNWGQQGMQNLLPSMVVDLLLENGIQKIKLFNALRGILDALVDSEIEVTVALSNNILTKMNDTGDVNRWVRDNISPYKESVNLKYLVVGSDPFSLTYPLQNYSYERQVLMHKSAQVAISAYGVGGKIKVTSTHRQDTLKRGILKPSDAEFRKDVIGPMREIIKQIKSTGAPLMLSIRPMDTLGEYKWPMEFSFFDGTSGFKIVDGSRTYTNMSDAIYDSFLCAVEKAGGKGVEIVVSQVGWPTDGAKGFNVNNAARFYKGLLNKLARNIGTPRRPGPLEVFAYNLLDENLLALPAGPSTGYQRHWGIYMPDGHPKFKIDFSGQGRDIYPEIVPGLTYMPERWCVFNGNTANMTLVNENFKFACNQSDCTNLAYGASCNNLDFAGNISYAFNMYYQTRTVMLNEEHCDFQGLGMTTTKNASVGQCMFLLQIVSNFGVRFIPGATILVLFYFIFIILFY